MVSTGKAECPSTPEDVSERSHPIYIEGWEESFSVEPIHGAWLDEVLPLAG